MTRDEYVARRREVALEEVALGFRTVRLLSEPELAEAQEGYSGPGWSSKWLVIAQEDELGDPIFVDLDADRLPVFTAMHGEGDWEPVQIADSFDGFVAGLEAIASVSSGREHPVGLEENPLSDDERDRVLAVIAERNPDADTEFWASWLDA